jgi:hypothetical protein
MRAGEGDTRTGEGDKITVEENMRKGGTMRQEMEI